MALRKTFERHLRKGVRKATCIVKLQNLLKGGGYRLERQGRFDYCLIDFFPNQSIVIISNSQSKKRFNTVEIETVKSGYKNKPKDIISKSAKPIFNGRKRMVKRFRKAEKKLKERFYIFIVTVP